MRLLVITPKFRRAYRKLVKKSPKLGNHIDELLGKMQMDIFLPDLGTHKLSGILSGLWACSCGYDCRIVFTLETDENTGNEVILLLDIGTHNQVY
jgi:mRNA interferase YafQ